MAKINIEIPDDLEREVKEFNLDVSGPVVESIRKELVKIVALKILSSKSKLTETDALELGRKLKKGRFEKLKKEELI